MRVDELVVGGVKWGKLDKEGKIFKVEIAVKVLVAKNKVPVIESLQLAKL